MKKIYIFIIAFFFILPLVSFAQVENTDNQEKQTTEKKAKKKKEKDPSGVKKGWTFGVLPSIAFDADLGFQGGILGNVFYYGDGSTYPDYMHNIYFEAAYTTKRYGLFRINFDSKILIPKHRLILDVTYIPDSMSDFLGFNGYQSQYNDNWRNSKKYSAEDGYLSRAFYKYKRDLLRFAADVQGPIKGKWRWAAGLGVLNYWAGSIDLAVLNKNKKDTDKFLEKNNGNSKILPNIEGLYDKYVKWGIISPEEATGGTHPYLRGGVVYDSRNKQMNASKGIYADAFLTYSAAFGNMKDYNNLKLNAVYQHYVPVYKDIITFAYRVGAQVLLFGENPFYMDNYWNMLYYQRVLYEAVGGGNSVRGLIRNRVTSDGFGYATAEFRFKVVKFDIARQHFYIALNPFIDMGVVLQPNKIDEAKVRANFMNDDDPNLADKQLSDFIKFGKDAKIYHPHSGAGMGMKIAMNENFVLSVDWAFPLFKSDNHSMANIYVKMGYLF